MAIQQISIEEFIALTETNLVVDVRSDSEFSHAHIPNAVSIPIFNDEERKVVGTAYKQRNREDAIKIGLDYYGVKMRAIVEQVENLCLVHNSKTVLVHCWRGGMRSQAVAWLLDLYGFKVFTLKGGYKVYRNWVLNQLEKPWPLVVLSGFTGSGKTEIIHELAKLGQATIDLEGGAHHKGSSFGALGMPPQPSNEQFENNLVKQLTHLPKNTKSIIVESESARIGNINIHHLFFNQMKSAKRLRIVVPLEARLEKIAKDYGYFDKNDLVAAVERIQKRLGGLEAKRAIDLINEGSIKEAFRILLNYYDRNYLSHSPFQSPYNEIELSNTDAIQNASIIYNELIKNQ
ncbi:MAG: tRNA 2-selenouridine(34) synthase MnmH [Crocinitomicaceae bacterium]|nr:tRNA 2-selenouridine(34) synthase MnmH [Crocinitomicaceae bacterium]